MVEEQIIERVCTQILPLLDEKNRRLLAGCLANAYGFGGIALVSRYSKLARNTIVKGASEIQPDLAAGKCSPISPTQKVGTSVESKPQVLEMPSQLAHRVRQPGGGRKNTLDKDPRILELIKGLLEETTYGDPERIVSYTNLSLRKIADILAQRHQISISRNIVSNAIELLGYSKQKNQKLEQVGPQHPDRNTQFEFINATAKQYLNVGLPVISVDCKKKENIGNFANAGSEYRRIKDPRRTCDHDFMDQKLGKVAPYGVLVLNNQTAFVNLGTSKDTAEFSVQSIRTWWFDIGVNTFPEARRLFVTCDGGGSNGWRNRLWKYELAKLAEEANIEIQVAHYPPGTSKFNAIEHRLFCYITKNWEGKPLVSIEVVIKLISSTTTKSGLKVICKEDPRSYESGIKVSDKDFERIDIEPVGPVKGWNYIIKGFKPSNDQNN